MGNFSGEIRLSFMENNKDTMPSGTVKAENAESQVRTTVHRGLTEYLDHANSCFHKCGI